MEFDSGNKAVLLETLTLYLDYDILPPQWISNELSKGASGISGAKSWDDIFGKFPLTRNKKIERQARAYLKGEKIRKQQGYKRSDDQLFPVLGDALGLPSGTAKEHYYGSAKKYMERILAIAESLGISEKKSLSAIVVKKLYFVLVSKNIPDMQAFLENQLEKSE